MLLQAGLCRIHVRLSAERREGTPHRRATVSCVRNDYQITEKRKEGEAMGLFAAGIITGILLCAMAELVRCALWFEIMHPEDDYWHRSAMIQIPMKKTKGLDETGESSRNTLHPAGDV